MDKLKNCKNSLKMGSQSVSVADVKVGHERGDKLRFGEVGVLDGRQRDEPARRHEDAG